MFSKPVLLLSAITCPVIFKITFGFEAFEVTLIDFLIKPTLLVSYLTWILSDSPGNIGFSGFLGIVHPHVDFTLEIINGASPVFVKRGVEMMKKEHHWKM